MRIGLRYCGSCNPEIEVDDVAAAIKQWATQKGMSLVSWREGEIDALILICGCRTACANDDVTRAIGVPVVVVAGLTVNGVPSTEGDLAGRLALAIQCIMQADDAQPLDT